LKKYASRTNKGSVQWWWWSIGGAFRGEHK